MKIFPTQSIKELDAYTIENEPIASIDLMERASQALTKAIMKRWEAETPITVFAGPGNNGGDALAVSRLLAEKGYQVSVYLFNTKGELSPDCEANKERLADVKNVDFHEVTSQFVPPVLTVDHVVIDGLFGSGLNKPLSGGFAAVVKYINASSAQIVAIDVPSGLMGEENTFNIKANIVRADVTLSLQLPKLAFLFAENQEFVGEWELLDIGLSEDAIEEMATDYSLLEAEDMQDLIEKLLFLARADQKRQVLHKDFVHLDELVDDAVRKMKLVAKEHTVRLAVNAPGIIYADPATMRQMMRIFLENAVKYTPAGGHIAVLSHRLPEKGCMELTFADDGIGIAQEDKDKIFERFYRADSARTKKAGSIGGTGLGLSIASWIAEQHEIEIAVESELDKGTKFILTIPLAEDDESDTSDKEG